ncbi:MAG: hypothetical protein JWP81_4134 [Ferruginibacter sp.]|nr:hypothetical protein [Ferruginibacter sp.]
MRFEYVFAAVYFIVSFWLIGKISFIKNADLSVVQIRLLFAFKITSGIACAYYFGRLPPIGDYLNYNIEGNRQYNLLLLNPALFFTDFKNDISTYGIGGLFASSNSFWAYLRFNLLYKFIAILDLITRGNFYLNSAMFSSIVFFGHIAFYRIYSQIYQCHRVIILFTCFLLPSLLLYTSCVHKDGMVFLCTGIVCFIFFRFLAKTETPRLSFVLFFLLGIAIIFLFRNYVVLALIPAMLIAFISKLLPYRKSRILITGHLFFAVLFFLSGNVNSSLNLPAAVVQRKADFAALGEANTNISTKELLPNVGSFINNLPQAINHVLFRPYLWEFPMFGVFLTALEIFLYQLIFVTFVFFRKKRANVVNVFNLFGCSFFINMMLIIGYTIPNIGAIVRYRSIFWIFIICPLLCNTDWGKLLSLITIKCKQLKKNCLHAPEDWR